MRDARDVAQLVPVVPPAGEDVRGQAEHAVGGRVSRAVSASAHGVQVVGRVVEHQAVGAALLPVGVDLHVLELHRLIDSQLLGVGHVPVATLDAPDVAQQAVAAGHPSQDGLHGAAVLAEGGEVDSLLAAGAGLRLAVGQRLAQELEVATGLVVGPGVPDVATHLVVGNDHPILVAADDVVPGHLAEGTVGGPVELDLLAEGPARAEGGAVPVLEDRVDQGHRVHWTGDAVVEAAVQDQPVVAPAGLGPGEFFGELPQLVLRPPLQVLGALRVVRLEVQPEVGPAVAQLGGGRDHRVARRRPPGPGAAPVRPERRGERDDRARFAGRVEGAVVEGPAGGQHRSRVIIGLPFQDHGDEDAVRGVV